MHEIAEFLNQHEPFVGLTVEQLQPIANAVEIEFFPRGQQIFEQGDQPAERVRIVRSGAVELLDRGQTLDLLGVGELFGHPSMLAGLPTGFAARAAEDTLCYRLAGDALVPLLTRPEGLRFLARSLLERPWRPTQRSPNAADPARRPVAAFVREPVVMCAPTDSVRDAAREMASCGASCALAALPGGRFGIITDRDLRVRVVGGEVSIDAPVHAAMTAPAFTVSPVRLGIDVMVEMIDRGIRHVPVVSPEHEVLGVVTDIDLLAADTRTPFMVRRAIARATDVDALVDAAQQVRPAVIALHDARVASVHICAIIAAVADALTRRALELLAPGGGALPPLAWHATGSVGRREAFPSSDIDSVLVWEGETDVERVQAHANDVVELLARCGFAPDEHGATARGRLFARSADAWRDSIMGWLDRPEESRLLIVLSVLEDAREVHRTAAVSDPFEVLRKAHDHPVLMRQMRRLALSHRPPTGFLRDIVVEHSGERRGRLDIKRGGISPVTELARYFSMATGTDPGTTPERLRAAAQAGALDQDDATTLLEAFELFCDLRMDHQVDQLRRGDAPDDYIKPSELNPLLRRYLREAFRSIARVQRKLAPRGVV